MLKLQAQSLTKPLFICQLHYPTVPIVRCKANNIHKYWMISAHRLRKPFVRKSNNIQKCLFCAFQLCIDLMSLAARLGQPTNLQACMHVQKNDIVLILLLLSKHDTNQHGQLSDENQKSSGEYQSNKCHHICKVLTTTKSTENRQYNIQYHIQ